MSITYYRADTDHPGIAAAHLPGNSFHVVEVGASSNHPGSLVFTLVEPESEVGAHVAIGGDDPEGALALVALQLIEWLREKRPQHECHAMFEGLLGIYPPETWDDES